MRLCDALLTCIMQLRHAASRYTLSVLQEFGPVSKWLQIKITQLKLMETQAAGVESTHLESSETYIHCQALRCICSTAEKFEPLFEEVTLLDDSSCMLVPVWGILSLKYENIFPFRINTYII